MKGTCVRVPRLFVDMPLVSGTEVQLDADSAHYLFKVLRLRSGAELLLFNGTGGEYQAVLGSSKSAMVSIGTSIAREAESPLKLYLAQGISRGERMDYTVQKAVELGVTEIMPLCTERCGVMLDGARMEKRVQHWQRVVHSACAQCGRNRVPRVSAVRPLSAWLDSAEGQRLVLHPPAAVGLAAIESATDITLLIGPEGGLSDAELAMARRAGFTPVHLGPRVLRTETAAVVALSVIQALWGDLRGDSATGD